MTRLEGYVSPESVARAIDLAAFEYVATGTAMDVKMKMRKNSVLRQATIMIEIIQRAIRPTDGVEL
jgi:hypothetical protein